MSCLRTLQDAAQTENRTTDPLVHLQLSHNFYNHLIFQHSQIIFKLCTFILISSGSVCINKQWQFSQGITFWCYSVKCNGGKTLCWLQQNMGGLCPCGSCVSSLNFGDTGVTWKNLSATTQLHVFPPGVQLCDLPLTLDMTVLLSYKGWMELEEVEGHLRPLWISAYSDWQQKSLLPTLPTASVFSFHPLKVKSRWAFTAPMWLPGEVAMNGDKVFLKEQDFHAAPQMKPGWHKAPAGRFLNWRAQWMLLIRPWQSWTEG